MKKPSTTTIGILLISSAVAAGMLIVFRNDFHSVFGLYRAKDSDSPFIDFLAYICTLISGVSLCYIILSYGYKLVTHIGEKQIDSTSQHNATPSLTWPINNIVKALTSKSVHEELKTLREDLRKSLLANEDLLKDNIKMAIENKALTTDNDTLNERHTQVTLQNIELERKYAENIDPQIDRLEHELAIVRENVTNLEKVLNDERLNQQQEKEEHKRILEILRYTEQQYNELRLNTTKNMEPKGKSIYQYSTNYKPINTDE